MYIPHSTKSSHLGDYNIQHPLPFISSVPPFKCAELWLRLSATHAGVGKVELNGPGASKFPVGQRVVATPWPIMAGNGTWQQYVVIRESVLYPVPDTVSDEAAAQFFVNPVTVYGFLEVKL